MNLMRPFFLLILFLSAALPAAGAESKFTIEPVGGKVTASWKGTADTSGIDLAPTDDEVAALAAHQEIEAIRISGTTRFTGKGFAALKGLTKLRELSLNGTGPGQFSEMFPPGSLEGYHALAELDQVTRLNLDHVMLPVEGAVIILKGMAGLEHAGLGVFADDKIVAAAAEAPKLKTLAFGHWATVPESPLTKAGAQAFARLRSLESLHAGEQAPPAGGSMRDLTEAVAKIEALKSLTLAFTSAKSLGQPKNPVTAADLEPLAALANLEWLGIQHASLDRATASKLTEIGSVKIVSFSAVKLDDGALVALKALPNLAVVEIWNSCDWSDADLEALKAAKPKVSFHMVGGPKK